MNLTEALQKVNYTGINPNAYFPSNDDAQWCMSQQLTSLNNITYGTLWFILFALVSLFIAEYMLLKNNSQAVKKWIFTAKIALYIFLFAYFYIFRFKNYIFT